MVLFSENTCVLPTNLFMQIYILELVDTSILIGMRLSRLMVRNVY